MHELETEQRPAQQASRARFVAACFFTAACGAVDAAPPAPQIGATQAAVVAPTTAKAYVCDWWFDGGPRDGERGKQVMRWEAGSTNVMHWYENGTTSNPQFLIQSTLASLINPEGTRYAFTSNGVNAQVDVRKVKYRYVETTRYTIHHASNGANVDCIELNGGSSSGLLGRIRTTFKGTYPNHGVCECGYAMDYNNTAGCIERCAAYWNQPAKWANGAPDCLASPKVEQKASCFANFDPSGPYPHDPTDTCGLFPNADGCPLHGNDEGEACGWGNAPFCEPGTRCKADNTCHAF